ncbi:MAG: FAD-dependent oxidoreductase [Verrucomicrobia bacterium]|nr:FAD-dependent oxidoreductase [Verrucomicrobiota bacterium]
MNDVVVLGAGLAGLGCARRLGTARVFEAGAHPGGHSYSHGIDGVFFDEGAHICHSRDQEWLDMIRKAAGEVIQIPQSRVSNFWHGHWVTYPVQNHLNELPNDARTNALTDFVSAQIEHKGKEPRNYLEWCRYQYGDYLTDNFYAEYTAKYWRVPMEELATDWLAGRLLPSQVQRIVAGAIAPQDETQSVFACFHYPAQGGFYRFFESLYADIDITCGVRAVEVDPDGKMVRFDNGDKAGFTRLASSIPLPDLIDMCTDVPDEVRDARALLRYIKLLCVNLTVARKELVPHHWFYIYDNDIDVSRVSVPSNLAPGSVPEGVTAMQAEIFRGMDEEWDVEALTSKAVTDLGRILKFDPDRDLVHVEPVVVPHAYVISDLNRATAVECIHSWLRSKGIFPMGLFGHWKFIWSDASFRSGEETAEEILKS